MLSSLSENLSLSNPESPSTHVESSSMEGESTNHITQDNPSSSDPLVVILTTTMQAAQPSFSITGWYQYQDSVGLSSATYLPQGLNTLVSGKTIAS